jgi:Spy/CpxP family protein refolding chaperone
MRTRAALLAGLTLLAVFVAGAAAGAAFERTRAPAVQPIAAPVAEGRPPIFARGPWMAQLDLSPAQRDSIQGIVERDRARADTLYREFRPRLSARFDSTTAAIEAVLTPEQRAEWQRIRAERRGRWRGDATRERGERRERRERHPGLERTGAGDVQLYRL